MTPHRTLAALLVTALALCGAAAAGAQTRASIEMWGAYSGVLAAPSGTLDSSYAPPLMNGTRLQSSARQTLTLDATHGPGLQGGLNLFPSRHLGLQFLLDRAHADLSGANGPYSVALRYLDAQPPDYVPFPFSTGSSRAWPATTGSLTQWSACFNVVARTPGAGRLSASISGGLAWSRTRGNAEALGYTEYRLGGHSVLFSDETHVAFALEPAASIGFDAGGDVSVAIGRRGAIVVGYRYLGVGTIDAPVRLTGITNEGEIVFSTALDAIAQQMQVKPARLRVSGSRLVIGLKIAAGTPRNSTRR
jgi:hypothetical protein